MSGIVGIFHPDGQCADRRQLARLAKFLAYRGPDSQEILARGPIGFGHAMLRTTAESQAERQPTSLENEFWITADARVDARAELVGKLSAKGRTCSLSAPDSELILQAYAAWGEECVEHLLGDFSFAIWDEQRKKLFCARDPFGIKPFYYAQSSEGFFFSNTLDCLRQDPRISEKLNESAIADFLLFGLNCDPATTTFADIQRLPPGHLMTVSADGARFRRYWSAPTDGRIRYRRGDEYVEHFKELLHEAVKDRLRCLRAGILLSGGLDSAAVAATARTACAVDSEACELRAYCVGYGSLIPNHDAAYARLVADFLRIPLQVLWVDHHQLFERWEEPGIRWPEPVADPLFAGIFEQFGMVARDCRVVLSGEGGDNLMYLEMWPYLQDLLRRGHWGRATGELLRSVWLRPVPYAGVVERLRRVFGKWSAAPVYPEWLAPEFAARVKAEQRLRDQAGRLSPRQHPIRPRAHGSLSLPQWVEMFELVNAGVTHCPVEARYPFLDLRVVNYLLALPPFPWFLGKEVERLALRGRIPERVRRRPKSPLVKDPVVALLEKPEARWVDEFEPAPQLTQYVNRMAIPPVAKEKDSERACSNLRPICLNFWLQSIGSFRYKVREVGVGVG